LLRHLRGPFLRRERGQSGTRAIKLLRRGAPVDVQERTVDFLDVNPAVLHNLESVRVLHQPSRGFLRISKGAVGGMFHCDMLFVWDLISLP
jgi:hypothetical protein